MSLNLKWLAQSTIYRDSIDLLAVIEYGNRERDVALPASLQLTRMEPNTAVSAPTLELSPQSARSLMQALWNAGIRPEDANLSSPAEVVALRNHIKFAEGVTGALLGRLPDNGPGSR